MRFVPGWAAAVVFSAVACSNTGTLQDVPDGAVGGRDGGGGAVDASRYEAWWSYPECQTADGSCPPDICISNIIMVLADRCGSYQRLEVGCVTRATPVAAWYCLMHESSSELIFTLYPPKGDGFAACTSITGGGLPTEGTLCSDGATTD